MIYALKNFFFRLIRPNFYVMNYYYNKSWDDFVLKSLEKEKPKIISKYEIELNGRKIWVGNYPYAYGLPRDSIEVRPSATTIKKLFLAIDV